MRRLHCAYHLLGAAFRGPDGEDAKASAHVEHHLVLELARVQANGVVVGGHARLVLEHVLLVIEVAVGAEVVGEVGVSDLVGLHDDHVGVGGFGAGHGGGRAGRLAGSAAENGGAERMLSFEEASRATERFRRRVRPARVAQSASSANARSRSRRRAGRPAVSAPPFAQPDALSTVVACKRARPRRRARHDRCVSGRDEFLAGRRSH